jgi:uncharacterized protein YkwD
MNNKQTVLLILLVSILLALLAMACSSGASAKIGSVAAPAGNSVTHTVQPGDTLADIASRRDTTVQAIVDANKGPYPSLATNPGRINVGWVLVIPGSQGSAVVQSGGPPPSAPSTGAPAFDIAAVELEIFRLVNEERAKASLPPLEWDPVLAEVARARSQDMVDRGYHSHNDPGTGELLVEKLLGERGYPRGGENVHRGIFWDAASAATTPVASWMKSAGHRENILRSEAHTTGVGVAIAPGHEVVATQVFLR